VNATFRPNAVWTLVMPRVLCAILVVESIIFLTSYVAGKPVPGEMTDNGRDQA